MEAPCHAQVGPEIYAIADAMRRAIYRTPFYVVSKLRYNDPKYSSCIGFEMSSKDSDFTSRGGTLWHPCTV